MKMSKKELLLKYKQNVEFLKQSAKDMDISENDINKLFEDCFCVLKNSNIPNLKYKKIISILIFIIKLLCIFLIIIFISFIVFYNHQPTLSLFLRNVQNFIYPGLKMLRLLAIPVIKLFPSLSEFYDETCLIENPYFQVTNMECWPCENVHSVVNLTASKTQNIYQSGMPYVVQTLNEPVTINAVKDLYRNNSNLFDRDAQRITSTNSNFTKAGDLLNFSSNNSDTHILWRINRIAPARLLRTIFPKSTFISSWSGQSTERYVMIDDLQAKPYVLPNPECSMVLLTQASGERTIILKPSKECSRYCRTVSVVLKPSYSCTYIGMSEEKICTLPVDFKDISKIKKNNEDQCGIIGGTGNQLVFRQTVQPQFQ